MLGYWLISKKDAATEVIVDASQVGLGLEAMIVRRQAAERRVICYASRSLNRVERRYSQTEKEALGIVWACERFHQYLYGIHFEIVTDHQWRHRMALGRWFLSRVSTLTRDIDIAIMSVRLSVRLSVCP